MINIGWRKKTFGLWIGETDANQSIIFPHKSIINVEKKSVTKI